jgi:cytoskeletal protein RodZ
MLPREVKQEFGERAHSERWISKVYKDNSTVTPNKFYAKAFAKSYAVMDLNISSKQWVSYYHNEISKIRSKRKENLWVKINQVEAITG